MSNETLTELSFRDIANRRTRRISSTPSAKLGLAARLLFTVFLVFNFPAFTVQLAMDPISGRFTGSPVLQLATIGAEIFAFAIILSSRTMIFFVLKCWPILVLVSLSFISVTWSRNPAATIHQANTYMTSALLGLALVGTLPGFQSIRFSVRVMVLGCILSIAWVLIFPAAAVHQVTDAYQTVHAGLWRGIFSHKQGLGYFAGLTTGLLIFYRTKIFPLPILIVSIVCSSACLVGTES